MAREYPVSPDGFRKISGVGETKLREFGAAFMGAIADHLKTRPRMQFDDKTRIAPRSTRTSDSVRDTLRRFRLGHTVDAIARDRDFGVSTILGHLAIAAEAGESVELAGLLNEEQGREIREAFGVIGWANVTGVREMLEERYDYGLLKLYRAVEGPRPEAAVTVVGAGSASLAAKGGHTKESPARNPVSAPVRA
jgi:ATP-dependent DNA helicase RecQ